MIVFQSHPNWPTYVILALGCILGIWLVLRATKKKKPPGGEAERQGSREETPPVNGGARVDNTIRHRPARLDNLSSTFLRFAPGLSREAALLTRNSVAAARSVSHLCVRWTIGETGDGPAAAETEMI